MALKKFYLTTPLYYVNDVPHIGHSYTNILADCVARFKRFEGRSVFFLTGTDEHGDKIARAAKASQEEPQAFVDRIVPRFQALWADLGITNNDFIRTTEKRHIRTVGAVLSRLHDKGDIYAGSYQGFYCTPCETFWSEAQLEKGQCPDCGRGVEALSEKNYFFKMSKYQEWLVDTIQNRPDFIRPVSRRNEILGFLKEPLNDLCISRPLGRLTWGIPLPFDPKYVTYVWADALVNYISACGWESDEASFKALWPADLHLIGKDILRHHAVIWVILLKALDIEPPRTILAHGWWTVQGLKMSKSKGNVVDPLRVIREWGRDAYRYFLLREVPVGQDGDFSQEALSGRYRNDLANDLGNLVNRALSMIKRYFDGQIPESFAVEPLASSAAGLSESVRKRMDVYDMKGALEDIWKVVERANRYVEESKPWALAKRKKERELGTVLYHLAETVRILALVLEPFLPDSARAMGEMIGSSVTGEGRWEASRKWGVLKPRQPIGPVRILFPRKDEAG